MAIEFEFYENPEASGEKSDKYHARAVTTKTATTNEIAHSIHMSSTLTAGDIKGVLTALSNEIASRLGDSQRVHLEGIGYFQATLKCSKEIDPKTTRAQSVYFKSVKFRADEELKGKLRYIQTVRSKRKIHSTPLTNEEVDRRVAGLFEKGDFLTRKRLEELCHLTPSTATRHINRLKEEGKIKNINTRLQPVFVAAQPDPEK